MKWKHLQELEQWTATPDARYWELLEQLSAVLSDVFLDVSDPLEDLDGVVEQASGEIDDQRYALLGNADGHILVLSITDSIKIESRHTLQDFDPGKDEIKNILVSSRRYSQERDVYVCTRRREGSKPPEPRFWRASFWRAESRFLLHPIQEMALERKGIWTPVPASSHSWLPEACFRIPIQNSQRDGLSVPEIDPQVQLLATSSTSTAHYADGHISWDNQPVDFGPEPPTAMALDESGQVLVVASAQGQLGLFRKGQPTRSHQLVAGAAVLSCWLHAGALELLLLTRDGSLRHLRETPEHRLRALWDRQVQLARSEFKTGSEWRDWLHADPEPEVLKLKSLFWLHASMNNADLLPALAEFLRKPSRDRPGTRFGEELTRLLREDRGRSEAVLQLYDSAGLAAREQLNRARPEATPALAARMLRNAWEASEDGTHDYAQAAAIGNLATRPFLHEATWREVSSSVAGIHAGDQQHWLLTTSDGLVSLETRSGKIPTQAQRQQELPEADIQFLKSTDAGSSEPEQAPLQRPRWLRGLGTLQDAVLIGHDTGASLLRRLADGRWIAQDLDPGQDTVALYGFAETVDQERGAYRIWLALQAGVGVFLDRWELQQPTNTTTPSDSPRAVSDNWQHRGRFLVRIPAIALALLPLPGGPQLAAATRSREMHWMTLREDEFHSQGSQRLDSNAVTLRYVSGHVDGERRPLLLVGTEGGWVYCFDVVHRRIRWTYRAGTSVQSLDCIGEDAGLVIGVCSMPHWLTLLDGEGRRRWRHHVGRRPSDLYLMPDASGQLERIGVVHEGGRFSLYRRCEQAPFQQRAQQFMQAHRDLPPGDRLRVAVALAEADYSAERAGEVQRPEARRLLLAQAASRLDLALGEHLDFSDIRCADVAAMARELHPQRADADVEALWKQALALLESYPNSRQGEMLAALYALRRRHGQDASAIETSLDELAGRIGEDKTEDLFLKAPDAALQAAQAWWDALPDVDAGFKRLHRLPLAVARQLRILIPVSHSLLSALSLLIDAAERSQGEPVTPETWARGLPRIDNSQAGAHPYLRAMTAARELRPDRWADVVTLLKASAQCPSGAGLLPAALRVPATSLRGRVPEDTAPLAQQEDWLTRQLGQRWQLPLEVERGWPAWGKSIKDLLRATEALCRQGLTLQLGKLVARTRLRVKARVLRWTGWQLRLQLELSHDGKLVLDKPGLELDWYLPEQEDQAHALTLDYAPVRVAPGDPPWHGIVDLSPPRDARQVFLRLRCSLSGNLIDTSAWPVQLEEVVNHASAERQSLLLGPPFDRLLLQRIKELSPGLHILVLDDVLQPEAVVEWLSERTGASTFALDAATAKLGPGRDFPKMLDLNALFRELEGRDALDFEHRYAGNHLPLAGAQGLLFLNFSGLAQRLERPELQALRQQIHEWLRRLAASAPAARWLLVLPSPLAQQWHAALLKQGVGLFHPAQLHTKTWADDHWRDLAKVRLCTPGEARQQLLAVGEDLRLLGAGTPADALRLYWARAEVAALRPAELLALVALAEARVRLRLNEIPAGAIAAERVETEARKHQPKTLAQVGDVMGDQRKLRRLQNVSRDLLVYGMDAAQDLEALSAEARALLQLSGFNPRMLNRLARLRLLQQVGSLHLLRPDLAQLLQQLQAQGKSLRDCALALADEDAWWQGIDLPALAQVRAEHWALWQPGAGASLKLAHASGRIWGGNTEPATLVSWIESLIGAAPQHPVTEGYVLLEQEGLPNLAGIALSLHSKTAAVDTITILGRPWLEVRIGREVQRKPGLPVIDSDHLRSILRSDSPRRAFWASLRAQLDLALLSPYVQEGAMPPGSPLFVGRRQIREEVARLLIYRSFLILGSRQVGKTSLLNQLWFEAQSRDDAWLALIDAQGKSRPELLLESLNEALSRFGLSPANAIDQALDAFAHVADAQQRTPILLINEIDGLLQESPQFLQQLRARHERGVMRFIFVGYAPVLWALNDIYGPMYHFTSGEGGHFLLGPLEREESRQLLRWLTRPPLDLEWLDKQHQEAGEALLLDAGYDTPWLLQDLCQALVVQLMQRGSGVITLDDVRRMLEQRPALLNKLESIELRKVLGDARANQLGDAGVWWILLALVHAHYPGDSDWRRLMLMQPPDFTPDGARSSCAEVIKRLPLSDSKDQPEQQLLSQWLQGVDFRELLSALTLTMIISASTRPDAPRDYCFAQNLYPIELLRAAAKGRTLEDRLLERTQSLLSQLGQGTIH